MPGLLSAIIIMTNTVIEITDARVRQNGRMCKCGGNSCIRYLLTQQCMGLRVLPEER